MIDVVERIKVLKGGQLYIPTWLRRMANVHETGVFRAVIDQEKKYIILVPDDKREESE